MRALLDPVANWIEEQFAARKLRWLVSGSWALGFLMIPLESFFGTPFNSSIPIWMIYALLTTFLSALVLALTRIPMRRELGDFKAIGDKYAELLYALQADNSELFSTEEWREEVSLEKHGDAVITKQLAIRAGSDPVPAIWHALTRNSNEHLDDSIKRRVMISAQYINPDESLGARIRTTRMWDGRRLRIFVHFTEPLAPGSLTKVEIVVKWPQYGRDLLDGQTEINEWTFRRNTVAFYSSFIIHSSFTRKRLARTGLSGTPLPPISKEGSSTKIHLNLDKIEVNRRYGYSVSLIDSD